MDSVENGHMAPKYKEIQDFVPGLEFKTRKKNFMMNYKLMNYSLLPHQNNTDCLLTPMRMKSQSSRNKDRPLHFIMKSKENNQNIH